MAHVIVISCVLPLNHIQAKAIIYFMLLSAKKKTMKNIKMQNPVPRLSLWTPGGCLQLSASLLWLPQAWVLAVAIGAMADAKHNAVWQQALSSAVIFVVLGVVRSFLDAAGARLSFKKARLHVSSVRLQTLNTLGLRSPLDTARVSSGEVASILTEQAEMIVPYLTRYQPVMLKVVVVPLVFAVAVAWHSWAAALILICTAPLIPFFMALIGWRAKIASEKQVREIGVMNDFLLDRLRGLSTIRAFNAVDIVAQRLRKAADTVREKTMGVLRIAFLSSAVLELFSALGVAMVACYIGFYMLGDLTFGVWQGSMTLTQGMFMLLLAPTFYDPLKEFSTVWHDRASGLAAVEAVEKMGEQGVGLVGEKQTSSLDAALVPKNEQGQTEKKALGIELKQITFSYPGAHECVLKNFSLTIQPGEKVALVAPSGSGKSSLLALIAGLLPVNDGNIQIDGVPLNNESANALRARMGWISQQPHVFAGTLLDNITLKRSHIELEQVQQAIDAAALSSVAQGRLDHRLGEGGSGLSGGEILRLALARAMVNPQLGLLLADEPTAHLDAQTAQEVIDGLLSIAKQGVTLIIATHDDRVLPYMDQVIRLRASAMENAQ